MFCREVKGNITAYLDGRLEPEKVAQVEYHVAGCANCTEKLHLVRQIPGALKTSEPLAPHHEFTRGVMQRIVLQDKMPVTQTQYQPAQPANQLPRLVLQFSSVAAALVLMVGVGVYFGGNAVPTSDATAAVYVGIADFANTLRSALSSPAELIGGLAIAAVVCIALWYLLKTTRTGNNPPQQDGEN